MRVCAADYSLDDLDTAIHVTNYSVQKSSGSTISSWQFASDYLQEDWAVIRKKIESLVYRSLKAASENQTNANCFELYGFDLILDEALEPWLIEINLSPACAERLPFLTDMLNDMAIGMLWYVQK